MGTRSSGFDEYSWLGASWAGRPTDGEIRALLVDRLREDPFTRKEAIRVEVLEAVVTMSGEVSSSIARRAADDDAWATPGVFDVNNHLRTRLRPAGHEGPRAA
ncbi:MAG: BON domain-containing protein [Actinomycetota bacterium]|nr:BON domain-containing protein [Actinomycetota bacterium]